MLDLMRHRRVNRYRVIEGVGNRGAGEDRQRVVTGGQRSGNKQTESGGTELCSVESSNAWPNASELCLPEEDGTGTTPESPDMDGIHSAATRRSPVDSPARYLEWQRDRGSRAGGINPHHWVRSNPHPDQSDIAEAIGYGVAGMDL